MRPDGEPDAAASARQAVDEAVLAVERALADLGRVAEPLAAARLATEFIDALTARREQVAAVRRESVAQLRPQHSYDELARLLGVSKSLIAFISREIRGSDPRYRRRRD